MRKNVCWNYLLHMYIATMLTKQNYFQQIYLRANDFGDVDSLKITGKTIIFQKLTFVDFFDRILRRRMLGYFKTVLQLRLDNVSSRPIKICRIFMDRLTS